MSIPRTARRSSTRNMNDDRHCERPERTLSEAKKKSMDAKQSHTATREIASLACGLLAMT